LKQKLSIFDYLFQFLSKVIIIYLECLNDAEIVVVRCGKKWR